MIAGQLNDTITIQKLVTSNNNRYGANIQRWEDYTRLRAKIEDVSGGIEIKNDETINSHSLKITTHLRYRINRKMRVVLRDEKYRIESVLHDRELMKTTINCSLINE